MAETDRLEGLDAAHVAVQAALEVVDRSVSDAAVDKPSSPHRPIRTDQELIQEFWVDVGYPSPASRFWERSSPSNPGEVSVSSGRDGGDRKSVV